MALITLIAFKAKKLCLCKEAFTSLFVVLDFCSLSTEFLKSFLNGATTFIKTTISRTKLVRRRYHGVYTVLLDLILKMPFS